MMNIEQLAIEHELMDNMELYGEFKDNEMLLKARREKLKKLEAFAKALQQQSEPVAEFRRGAKAMFDYVLYATANNWHGNPEINKQCNAENAFANNLITNALEEISPNDAIEWKNIIEMQQEINNLKATQPPNTVGPEQQQAVGCVERNY